MIKGASLTIVILLFVAYSCNKDSTNPSGSWIGLFSAIEFTDDSGLFVHQYGESDSLIYQSLSRGIYYSPALNDTLKITHLSDDSIVVRFPTLPPTNLVHVNANYTGIEPIKKHELISFLRKDILLFINDFYEHNVKVSFRDSLFTWFENDSVYKWRLDSFQNNYYLEMDNAFETIIHRVTALDSGEIRMVTFSRDANQEIESKLVVTEIE